MDRKRRLGRAEKHSSPSAATALNFFAPSPFSPRYPSKKQGQEELSGTADLHAAEHLSH